MNTLRLLDNAESLDSKLENYEKIYLARHPDIKEEWIRKVPQIQLAASLEWQVANQTITLYKARKQFIALYPECNRLAVGKTVIEAYGYVHQDHNYALGSVLSLIEPYDDSIREL